MSLPIVLLISVATTCTAESPRPHIVLVMADDMGWGQTGYYGHTVLETPHLDAMAAGGLRFDRFYAGAPNCSPTRATVLTGRSHDRTGVHNHGYPLRLQEPTVAEALRDAGYATGHFGKWHLNGLRGPGAPILARDDRRPDAFGFDTWLSVTNFFDRNPIMSRGGEFVEFEGDSSEIIVREALQFIREQVAAERTTFTVIWYGTPHSPWMASDADKANFAGLNEKSQEHYGELVAMDRSLGTLRRGLRELRIAENTLVWFCSDNGGLRGIEPDTVGGLRGFKGTLYEGGLRVPGVIEWPAGISEPRVTSFPAVTMDIFPTIVDVAGLPESVLLLPQDGMSLVPLFTKDQTQRDKPIPFRHQGRAAIVDNQYKLLTLDIAEGEFVLYDLSRDPQETTDLSASHPEVARRLRNAFLEWNASVETSLAGRDYPEGKVTPAEPPPQRWRQMAEYQPFFNAWKNRPEYRSWLSQ